MLEHADRLEGVHPRIERFAVFAAAKLAAQGFDLLVYEGRRTLATQQLYYSYGRMQPNPNTGDMTQVTWTLDSAHIVEQGSDLSYATDFVARKAKLPAPADTQRLLLGSVVHEWNKAHPDELLDWGGDWTTSKDIPHVEVHGWRALRSQDRAAPKVASSAPPAKSDNSSPGGSGTLLAVAVAGLALIGGVAAAIFL